ncbi:NB-ARC domain-containing protein [Solicola gregarius]|uniref:NB-ARC domain-containing protein n=1 Tax=Solicola gregarius TaxID=2908642 RepID=A0AA46YMQ7_9ACTN|nr:NB-ARC domain-containing protein [Solicola gregarius]UYM06869.1 NB-ARC domain-containing protein [Solicola gregarius]
MVGRQGAARGSLLRALRASKGFTQQEIAERSQVTERSIREIERGAVTRPRTDSLLRIAAALDLGATETTAFVRAYRGGGRTDTTPPNPIAATPPAISPAELPRDLPDFVGRIDEIEQISAMLRGIPASAGPASVTVVISGAGGLGKSSLAIHAAHRVADDFPDGQVFVDLSANADADEVHEALGDILWSFGMREDIPMQRGSRVRMMRSLTARTRALLVIDNVPEDVDVADLLPSGAGNALLVTSRSRLSGLHANLTVELRPLTAEQGASLLMSAAGDASAELTGEQRARIAELCGMHPLALRVCGARLSARSGPSAADLIARLETEESRIEQLDYGSFGVRSTLVAGVRTLARSTSPADAAALDALSLMSSSPLRDFSVDSVAALTRTGRAAAVDVVERLGEVQMVSSRRPGRLGMHDLSRLAVASEVPADPERVAAGMRCFAAMWLEHWRRLGELFLDDPHCVYEQLHDISPDYESDIDSRRWLEAEYPNMRAAASGEWVRSPLDLLSCYQLSYPFHGLAIQRGDSTSAADASESLAVRAEEFDMPYVAAQLYRSAAETMSSDGDQQTARVLSSVATRHAARVRDPLLSQVARSHVLSGRALIEGRLGNLAEAESGLRDAIRILRGRNHWRRQVCLHNLAYACRLQGRQVEAAHYTLRAVSAYSRSYGLALKGMAELLLELGNAEAALTYVERAAAADAKPHTYRRRADHAVLRSKVLRALGRSSEADQAERTATALADNFGFGEVYERLADKEGASG